MIALAVVVAQYVGTFDTMVTGRGDARATDPANQVTIGGKTEEIAIGADASFSASALLRLRNRHWDFTLGYTPSIVVPDLELQVDRDVESADDPTILNGGSAGVRWHDRFSWFALTESGAYGYITTAIPYAGPPTTGTTPQQQTPSMTTPGMTTTPGQTTPGMTTTPGQTPGQTPGLTTLIREALVQYAASSTNLAVGTAFGRHTTATLSGGYSLSGGLDQGTAIVPYIAGPAGTLSVATTVSPSEAIFTTASGSYTYSNGQCALELFTVADQNAAIAGATKACLAAGGTPTECMNAPPAVMTCVARSTIVQLVEGYRRQTSLFSSVSATVGIGGLSGREQNDVYKLGIVPVFSLNYIQELYTLWPGVLSVTVSLAPTADLLTSVVSDEVTAVAMLTSRVTKVATVVFSLTGIQSIPIPANDSPLTGIAGSVEGRFRLNKQADVVVGDQEYWQDQFYAGAPGTPAQSSTTFTSLVYVGVTLRAPTLHF